MIKHEIFSLTIRAVLKTQNMKFMFLYIENVIIG